MGLRGYIDEDSGNIWVNDGDGMRLQGLFDRESGNIWTHGDGGGGDGRGAWGCFLTLLLVMTFPIWGILLIAGCQALQEWRRQARPRGHPVPAVIQPVAEPPAARANPKPPAAPARQARLSERPGSGANWAALPTHCRHCAALHSRPARGVLHRREIGLC